MSWELHEPKPLRVVVHRKKADELKTRGAPECLGEDENIKHDGRSLEGTGPPDGMPGDT